MCVKPGGDAFAPRTFAAPSPSLHRRRSRPAARHTFTPHSPTAGFRHRKAAYFPQMATGPLSSFQRVRPRCLPASKLTVAKSWGAPWSASSRPRPRSRVPRCGPDPSPASIPPGARALPSHPPLSPGPLPGRPPGPGRRPLSPWRAGLTPTCRLPSALLAESGSDRHRVDPALPAARPRSTAHRPPAAALTPSPFSLLRWPSPPPRSGARPACPPARPGLGRSRSGPWASACPSFFTCSIAQSGTR